MEYFDSNRYFSLTGNTWAYKIDILPSAQHRLSSSIVEPTGSAVDKIKAVETVWYKFNELGGKMGFPEDKREMGLMAQDLMAVEPALVREMDWLGEDAAGEGQGGFYMIDYNALNVLVLDALNELNARAEAAKLQLGITPAETYPTRATTTTLAPFASNFALSVTPTSGPEGSESVWTLTCDNAVEGLVVGFKITGDCDINDISCDDPRVYLAHVTDDDLLDEDKNYDTDYDSELEGRMFGIFWFDAAAAAAGSLSITLKYTMDNVSEGNETIIMTMKDGDNKGGPGPGNSVTATAVITS
jgi:hypothetical protein